MTQDQVLQVFRATGALLEGHPPDVDVPADYRPEDLVAGRDTLIEAARQLHCTNRPDFAARMGELYRQSKAAK